MDGVGVKLRGKKERQPLNYQMGVHIYNRLDDERKLVDFMEEQEFLPVIITGGLIPEILIGRGYAFRCTADEKVFAESKIEYIRFTDFVKKNAIGVCSLIETISKAPVVINEEQNEYQKYKPIIKNFMTVSYVWKLIGEKLEISKVELEKEKDVSGSRIWKAVQLMDRYDGEYDIQDVVRKCFTDQASKGKIGIRLLGENAAVDEIENHILYDDDFYYVTDSILRTVCAPLLATVSFVQLKNEMANSGMVDCNDGNFKNFTKKKLIWRSYGWQERVRFIWIKKEALMTEEGLFLENIWRNTEC